jgi:hypothetical protein
VPSVRRAFLFSRGFVNGLQPPMPPQSGGKIQNKRKYMNRLFDKKESWTGKKRKAAQDELLVNMVKLGYKKSSRIKQIFD